MQVWNELRPKFFQEQLALNKGLSKKAANLCFDNLSCLK